jgi:stress-induced morphogen
MLNQSPLSMKTLNLLAIETYLQAQFQLENVRIQDDSHLHQTHKQFQAKKAYLTVWIPLIKDIPKLKLHRMIMKMVEEVCNQPIHAISIRCSTPSK